jgi:hypothetical protein
LANISLGNSKSEKEIFDEYKRQKSERLIITLHYEKEKLEKELDKIKDKQNETKKISIPANSNIRGGQSNVWENLFSNSTSPKGVFGRYENRYKYRIGLDFDLLNLKKEIKDISEIKNISLNMEKMYLHGSTDFSVVVFDDSEKNFTSEK